MEVAISKDFVESLGYLTGDYKTAFNAGKVQETEMREKHNGIEI